MRAPERSESIARGAAWLLAGQAAVVVAGFAVHVALGRVLGPRDYGLAGITIALLGLVQLVQQQGAPQALSRAVASAAPEWPAWRASGRLQWAVTLAGAALLILAGAAAAAAFGQPELFTLLAIAGVTLPGTALLTLELGLLNGRRRMRSQGALTIAYAGVRVIAVPAAAVAAGAAGAVAAFGIAPLAVGLLALRVRPDRSAAAPLAVGPLARFALPNVAITLALTALTAVDLLVVEGVVGAPLTVGAYTAAQNLGRITLFGGVAIGAAAFPQVAAALARGDRAAAQTAARGALDLVVPFACGGAAILAGGASVAVSVVYGSAFDAAGPLLVLLAPALALAGIAAVPAAVVAAAGRPWSAAGAAALGVAVQATAGVIGAEAIGARGAALGTLAGSLVAATALSLLALRVVGPAVDLRRVSMQAALALPTALIASLRLGPAGILGPLAAGLFYVAALALLGALPEPLQRRLRARRTASE